MTDKEKFEMLAEVDPSYRLAWEILRRAAQDWRGVARGQPVQDHQRFINGHGRSHASCESELRAFFGSEHFALLCRTLGIKPRHYCDALDIE